MYLENLLAPARTRTLLLALLAFSLSPSKPIIPRIKELTFFNTTRPCLIRAKFPPSVYIFDNTTKRTRRNTIGPVAIFASLRARTIIAVVPLTLSSFRLIGDAVITTPVPRPPLFNRNYCMAFGENGSGSINLSTRLSSLLPRLRSRTYFIRVYRSLAYRRESLASFPMNSFG